MSNNTVGKDTQAAFRGRAPPALSPEGPGLVQPWKDFVSHGWVHSVLTEFTPGGVTVKVTVDPALLPKDMDKSLNVVPPGLAKEYLQASGKWTPKGPKAKSSGDKQNALPKKTLVKSDFEGGPEKLKARALAVATAIGDTTARGRIGSLGLMRDGISDFNEWWNKAPPSPKARLLMDAKNHNSVDKASFTLLSEVLKDQCPFRGPVPTPSQDDDGAEADALFNGEK
jgi:hypothetical protein